MRKPDRDVIEEFLATLHSSPVEDLEPLSGGFWSNAYGYRTDGRELVLRLSDMGEGFEMDRVAERFRRPGLPIPVVDQIGRWGRLHYAISHRAHGRFLESIASEDADAAAGAITSLLGALRAVPAEPDAPIEWFERNLPGAPSWAVWLRAGLQERPSARVSGWRARLAADPRLDNVYRRSVDRVEDLVDVCPERRDLLHGDLLHGNVLVDDQADTVTAVFSWKTSVRGDFLFDLAWLSFWSAWHHGIAALDPWRRCRIHGSGDADWDHAAERHHCYEIRIGATHLGWYAWVDDQANLLKTAERLEELLDRGPRRD